MDARKVFFYSALLVVCVGFGVAYLSVGNSGPRYVQEAVSVVSSKLSYSVGENSCHAKLEKDSVWKMVCTPANGSPSLDFSVMSSDKAPYDVPTSFYLVAENASAKKSSAEDLLSYMMININSKS